MSATAVGPGEDARPSPGPVRRWPLAVAAGLILLGALAVAVRLDAPADGTRVTAWRPGGVVVAVAPAAGDPTAPRTMPRTGDEVREISSHALTAAPGGLAPPAAGSVLAYRVEPANQGVEVKIGRASPLPMLGYGWGNLVFVVLLAALAVALFVRRPDEPSTTPLLVAAGGLLGSTLAIVAGVPALTMATGGPLLWLYNLNVIGAYAIAWGALMGFGLLLPGAGRVSRAGLVAAAAGPPAAMVALLVVAAIRTRDWMGWFGAAYAGTTVIVATCLVVVVLLGVRSYRRSTDDQARSRLRWVAGGTAVTAALSMVGWHLPELLLGEPLLPSGALGLSGLPFIAGVAVALRRHRLFDIERLANRSLTYLALTAVLLAGYAAAVGLLSRGLGLSGGVAAAIAAIGAALALAPVQRLAQRTVNHLMYGDRDDPAGVLARLGSRMQAAMLPDDVLPAVVETVAQSLRLPYAAIDLRAADGEFQLAAEHGTPVGVGHSEDLSHHGSTVGRLRVSARGVDDPLDQTDLALIRSLAGEVGPAVQAVRLHQDLVRSRAEVIALREAERRRLRRDLHDGLGPALAAIGLKAGLAARGVPVASPERALLDQIDVEVKDSLAGIRRLVEGLRPPALDELGLLAAIRSRAASLAGDLVVEVTGELPSDGLPAAVETAAYWIAVEAMTNTARHSGGTRCALDARPADDVLVLVIADDGGGLEPGRAPGVGLRSMRERAAEVGGTVSVQSTAEGTEVVARLPLMPGGLDVRGGSS